MIGEERNKEKTAKIVKANGKYRKSALLFWGAAFFIGLLVSVVISYNGYHSFEALVIGICVFMAIGLILQGIIMVIRKD
ncbi:MAG: hypothetical protein FWH17_01870 [Oscillospiraceae bacterium]|nr:hypothetical protein [Oscillospiraceae bacterium]